MKANLSTMNTMRIACEMCDGEDWKMTIHTITKKGRLGDYEFLFTGFRCESCGMVYPLHSLMKYVQVAGKPVREKLIAWLREGE